MSDVAVVLLLFAIAGGGIIVVDAMVIRKIRRMRDEGEDES